MGFSDIPGALTDELRRDLATTDRIVSTLATRMRSENAAADTSGAASFLLESFLQFWLRRTLQFLEGCESEWRSGRLVSAATLSRAVLENIAALGALVKQGAPLLESGAIGAFHNRLLVATFSTRIPVEGGLLPSAVNVLTHLAKVEEDFPGISTIYAALCEVAHPNVDGISVFGELDRDSFRHTFGMTDESKAFVTVPLAAGVELIATGAHYLARCDKLFPRIRDLERQHGATPRAWPGWTPLK